MKTDDKLKTLIAMNEANRCVFELFDKFEGIIKTKDDQLLKYGEEVVKLREQLEYYINKAK